MSLESSTAVWEAFRSDPGGDHYLPDAHIVFLPTGTGAANEPLIRKFYQSGAYSHPKKLSVEEKVIHRTVGVSSAVDEVSITVKFVSGHGGWLLPGIEQHFLEDVEVTFPMVICGSMDQGRIAGVRYMWDNAAVLKMARLIGSRNAWPIVAEAQVDALREPSRFRLNPYGDPIGASGGTQIRSNISSIFNAAPPTEPSPSIRSTLASSGNKSPSTPSTPRKGHPALTSTAFDYLKNAPSPFLEHETDRKLGYVAAHDALASSPPPPTISSSLVDSFLPSPTSSSSTTTTVSSPSRAKKGHPALTSQIHFGVPPPEPAPRQFRKVTDNIFGHLTQQEQPSVVRLAQTSPPPLLPLPTQQSHEQQPETQDSESESTSLGPDAATDAVVVPTTTTTTTIDNLVHELEQQVEDLTMAPRAETPVTPPIEHKDLPEQPILTPPPPPASTSTAGVTAMGSPTSPRRVHPNYRSQISFG